MKNMKPVFLCGALRSGSTVLGLMLRHHPNIIAPGEFDFLFDCVTDSGDFVDTEYYLDWLVTCRIFQAHKLNVISSGTYEENIEYFIKQLSNSFDHTLSLNVHRNFHRIPYMFPNARYIHLKRDARDVARSSIGMGWCGNVYYGVDHWIDTEKSWSKLKLMLKEEQFIEIKFEDLIANPEYVLSQICNFLGLSYSEKMLEYPENSTYSKPDISLVEQWKRKQLKKQVQLIEFKTGEMIKLSGYSLSGFPAIKPNLLDKIALYIQNRIFRMYYSIRHFGVSLYFTEKLTRLPFLKYWHTNCVLKMNDVEKNLLK